jgi:acetyltransferase-like isoleucine patch superfamily enzyme
MYDGSLEQFEAAVNRLAELHSDGALRLKVSAEGVVHFTIDRSAKDLPPKGGGLYAEIMDVMTAIARSTSVEDFVAQRSVPSPDFEDDEGEDEQSARGKYRTTGAAFPARQLRPGLAVRVRRRLRSAAVSCVIAIAKRGGYLPRAMTLYAFRRLIGPDGRRSAWRLLGASIDDTALIGPGIRMRNPSRVSVGAGTKLGGHISIEGWGEVTIGRHVLMNNADLFTSQHYVDDPGLKGERRFISIGDFAWLPHKIILLPGVRIGSHAVVGTGSVVSRDVPDYGVAVGNPARVVKERARVKYSYTPTSSNRPPIIR